MIQGSRRTSRRGLIVYELSLAGAEGIEPKELAQRIGATRGVVRTCVYEMNRSGKYPHVVSTGARGRAPGRYWLDYHKSSGASP